VEPVVSAAIEYGWRVDSQRKMRGGFMVVVEKFWCTEIEGDDAGWRWSGTRIIDGAHGEPSTGISEPMSRAEATERAEAWLGERLEEAKSLAVYSFAGLEVAP
jgi:hypothetical protein